MIKCEICKKTFKSLKALASHIVVHNIKVKDYYDTFIKTKDNICLNYGTVGDCKKFTNFKSITVGYHDYCSKKCLCNAPHIKKHRSESKLGDKHWLKKSCCSHPCKGKTYDEIHGKDKAAKLRKILSKKQTEIMNNGWAAHMNSFIKNPSKPQVKLFKICKSIFPETILNYKCLNYSIDIAIIDEMIAIEYDGSYWHQDKDADLRRQKNIERQGWSFLRYTDYVPTKEELQKDVKKLIQNRV